MWHAIWLHEAQDGKTRFRDALAGPTTHSAPNTDHGSPSIVLANGDQIQIGKFRLVFLTWPTTG